MIGKTMLFNPFTGAPRHPSDIKSDPAGILVWDGEEPLIAARASLPKPADAVAAVEQAAQPVATVGYRMKDGERHLAVTIHRDANLQPHTLLYAHPQRGSEPLPEDREREAFEAWMLEDGGEPLWITKYDGGSRVYADLETENMWLAWKARAGCGITSSNGGGV